tara:strand:+ start:2783 stop:2935 length:153 start_codon:yes stop_codon:yes gene_type:complete
MAIFKGLGVFVKFTKSFGLGNYKFKIITKQKALAASTDGNEKFPCLPYLS